MPVTSHRLRSSPITTNLFRSFLSDEKDHDTFAVNIYTYVQETPGLVLPLLHRHWSRQSQELPTVQRSVRVFLNPAMMPHEVETMNIQLKLSVHQNLTL